MSDDTNPYVEPDLPQPERPEPVRDMAKATSKVTATVGGIITALASFGLLTVVQADAAVALLGLIPGVLSAGFAVWSAFRTASTSRALVTPDSDPRRWVDGVLTELAPAGRHSREG